MDIWGDEIVKKSIKIRLLPTKKQEVLMLKSIGCSRFAYNWALNKCNEKYNNNEKYSTLLGVTGSGKTFTMANIIQEVK